MEFPDIEYTETATAALAGANATIVVTTGTNLELDEGFDTMLTSVVVGSRRCIEHPEGIIYEG